MTPKEQLQAARELLSDKARWTTGWFAHDKDNEEVDSGDPAAVCWCAFGAINKVAERFIERGEGANEFLERAALEIGGTPSNPARVNDRLGYEATLQMFDRAIELASA